MKIITKILIGAAGVAFSLSAAAAVKGSKHDLSSTGTGLNIELSTSTSNTEVCVFCHTPHGANMTLGAPLWNKNAGTVDVATPYATSTMDGLNATGISGTAAVSVACLSCHDGSQAMDMMMNKPGSGGAIPGGSRLAGAVTATASMDVGGKMIGITAIGSDGIANDHPIGVQYGGGGTKLGDLVPNDKDGFKDVSADTVNATNVFWVDTSVGTAAREKTDMILFTRNTSGAGYTDPQWAGEDEPFVECASCHDVHNGADLFLRIPNSGSDVCLSCHIK
jgi:predicted CXXCH cytochrome family protein